MKRNNIVGIAVFFAGAFSAASTAWGLLKGVMDTYGVVGVCLCALAGGFVGVSAFFQKSTTDGPPPPTITVTGAAFKLPPK